MYWKNDTFCHASARRARSTVLPFLSVYRSNAGFVSKTTVHIVNLFAPSFGTVTRGVVPVLGGHLCPIPRGGRASPKIFGPPTCMHMVWERATKFCMVIKLDERKIFTGSTTPPALAKICVTRMLTRNVLMVVNLCTSPINCCCNTLGSITVIPIKQLIFQTFPQHSSS